MPLLVSPIAAVPAALLTVGLPALVGLVAVGIAEGRLPSAATAVPCANLQASRGTPRRWLVAHVDSKRQALSLAGRVVAAAIAVLGVALLLLAAAWRVAGPLPWPWALASAVPALIGGGLLSRGHLADGSPGAVDNATGLIAALVAAEALRATPDVGILITDAEEWGMEGARAWAAPADDPVAFVNFDGLDDRGPVWITPHRGCDPADRRVLAGALRDQGYRLAARALPAAIPVDGQALAARGHRGLTVSRGDLQTARVVHTTADAPARTTLATAIVVGLTVARTFWQPVA